MGAKVVVYFNQDDVFKHTCIFKTHREFVEYLFKKKGLQVTQWNWDKNPISGKWQRYADGIKFMACDIQGDKNNLVYEVHGEVGVNLVEIPEVNKIEVAT